MKVALQRERTGSWHAPGAKTLPVTQAYPFFRSAFGQYVHRVRSGGIHVWHGEYTHTHFRLWCGGTGFLSPNRKQKGELFATAPNNAIFCAICEGKAIGAGMDGARVICGRKVMFNPRV